jgi:hypothetical protein
MPRTIGAPTDLAGCELWLDAQDLASITKDGSNLVSQWSDKSGNAKHAVQATPANQPTYNTTGLGGGLPCIDWASAVAATRLVTPNIAYGAFTAFFVLKSASTVGYTYVHELYSGTPNLEYMTHAATPHSAVKRAGGLSYRNFIPVTGGAFFADSQRHVYTRTFNGMHATNNARVDGAATQGTFFHAAGVGDPGLTVSTGPIYIGNADVAVASCRAAFGEIIFFSRCLSDGELVLVERYLAKKWAVAPQLARTINSPLAIQDCAMWYDASQGVTYDGNGVSQWNDSSGNARHLTQTVDANKPTYNPSNAAFGGKPTVDWDTVGNGDRLDRAAADNLTQPLTIFACTAYTPVGSADTVLFNNQSSSQFCFEHLNGTAWQLYAGFGCQFPTPPVGTRPFVASLVANNLDSLVRINGVGVLTRAPTLTIGITSFRLGSHVNGFTTQNWNGPIAEFLVYRRRLTDGEITAVEAYLKRKYAL